MDCLRIKNVRFDDHYLSLSPAYLSMSTELNIVFEWDTESALSPTIVFGSVLRISHHIEGFFDQRVLTIYIPKTLLTPMPVIHLFTVLPSVLLFLSG